MKNKKDNELIIPEMEPLESIKIEAEPKKIQENKKVEKEPEPEKIKTNSTELLEVLNESIRKLNTMSQKANTLFKFTNISKTGFISKKYRIDMPKLLGNRLGRKIEKFDRYIFNRDSSSNYWKISIANALKVCLKYLKIVRSDLQKSIATKKPIFNDQHFATDGDIIINDNEKLDFIENSLKECKNIHDKIKSYNFLNKDYERDLNELFETLINGLERIKKYGFKRIIKGKSFSELTDRLDSIYRCI